MSCSLCWDPCGRTSSKNPSSSAHIDMGQRSRCPSTRAHHLHPPTLDAISPSHPELYFTRPIPGPGALARGTGSGPDGAAFFPFAPARPGSAKTDPLPLAVDFVSRHGVLRFGLHFLLGVWKDQLIRLPQVLEVSKCGKI